MKNPLIAGKIIIDGETGSWIYNTDGTTIIDKDWNIDAPITSENWIFTWYLTVAWTSTLTGATTVTGILTASTGLVVTAWTVVAWGTTTSSGAWAVAITGAIHEITTWAADALTLADWVEWQRLSVVMVSDGWDGTLTPTSPANFATLTFDNYDTADLLFTAGKWYYMWGNAAIG